MALSSSNFSIQQKDYWLYINFLILFRSIVTHRLPRWCSGKKSVCQWRDMGSIAGSGRSPGAGNGNPLQHSCLGNPHGQRNLKGYSPWGHKKPDTTEHTRTHISTHKQTAFLHLRNCFLLACNLQKQEKQALSLPGRVTICGAGSETNANKKRKNGSVECGALWAGRFWCTTWESWSETCQLWQFLISVLYIIVEEQTFVSPNDSNMILWFSNFNLKLKNGYRHS